MDNFGRLVASKHMKLKTLLMDQKFLAGIGNIYSDEILFGAGLRWDRMSDSLSGEEIRRLYRAMVETLQDAVKYRGSSLADEQYVDLNGKPGEYQVHHKVYAARASRAGAAASRSSASAPAGGPRSSARRARFDPHRGPGRRRDTVGGPHPPTCPAPRFARRRRPPPAPVAVPAMSGGTIRRRVCVSGRVQGVWFRESCRDQALAGGVAGWVRNLADGRVEVVLEGPPPPSTRSSRCRRGPRRARADAIEVVDEAGRRRAGLPRAVGAISRKRPRRARSSWVRSDGAHRSAEFCEGEPAGCSSSR